MKRRNFKILLAVSFILALLFLLVSCSEQSASITTDQPSETNDNNNSSPASEETELLMDKDSLEYIDRTADGYDDNRGQLRFYIPEGYEYNAELNIALKGTRTIQQLGVGEPLASGETLESLLPDWDNLLAQTSLSEEQVAEMRESVHAIDVQGKRALAYSWTSPLEGDYKDYHERVCWADDYGVYYVLWNIETDDEQAWKESLEQFHALLQIAETGPASDFYYYGDPE